jgi:signal transduction histidine kinase
MDSSDQLKRANEEIYKQNFELSIRNKTLSVLRTLYTITMSTLEIGEMAQGIVDTIITELNFPAALICLIDKDNRLLKPLAVTKSPRMAEAAEFFMHSSADISVSLDHPDNLIIKAVNQKQILTATGLADVLNPLAARQSAEKIAEILGIKTTIIYPLSINDKSIGALVITLAKEAADMSRSEKETLEELLSLVSIALDRAQLHLNLRQANEKLQVLDKAKNEFVSLASHELRTPMTAIKSYVWMVLNDKAGPVTDATRKYLNIVLLSTERLIHLVNDMLDISRIESGKAQLNLENFDFSEVITLIDNEFSAKAEEKHLAWETHTDGNLPKITADKDKIIQVLENLVGNSFKFTPAGGRVSVTVTVRDNRLCVAVTDTGRGISPDDIPQLFTKFTRLGEKFTTYSQPGTGLGLFLSKQYVEMHHGTIMVESAFGTGSTFTFTLPLVNN